MIAITMIAIHARASQNAASDAKPTFWAIA
jgi:hypothetical protein